jgi:hypothetical protein
MQKRMGARIWGDGRKPGVRGRARWILPLLLALTPLLTTTAAQASFHLVKIREVYPAGDSSYVVLQMYSPGEYLVAGHHIVAYNANGSVANDFPLPSNVSSSSPNNATILVADSGYPAAFPSGPAADDVNAGLNLSASAGAICWVDGSPPDCVSWGSFTGPFPPHTPTLVAGTPASPSGVSAGKALRRTIAPGCSTLLEPADDSDSSATDFSEQTPNPRSNASPVTESTCTLPVTTIDSKPKTPTNSDSASFTYHSTPAGASFECKLDSAAFQSCQATGIEYIDLTDATHAFQVRATNGSGTGVAASHTWVVDTDPPAASIKTHPVDPSPGNSAAFTYQSDELNSKFECSLAAGAAPDSFSSCPATGRTYTSLANGTYTFKVRAIDQAGNSQAGAAQLSWEVDNSLADTTPPETTIDSKPPDPSDSPSVSFAYSSNEPGSTFECSLDAGAFSGCATTGITYGGLGSGAHSFQVRAIDPSTNVDPTPAGYSFTVALASQPVFAEPAPPSPAPGPALPNTLLTAKLPGRTHDRTPTIRFRATSPGAIFQCKLDNAPFKACRSPFTTKKLAYGPHVLLVRATSKGSADPTPAAIRFKVVKP